MEFEHISNFNEVISSIRGLTQELTIQGIYKKTTIS
jgi:hypothetical protein